MLQLSQDPLILSYNKLNCLLIIIKDRPKVIKHKVKLFKESL